MARNARPHTLEALFLRHLQQVSNRIHNADRLEQIMIDASVDICRLFNADRLTLYAVSPDGQSIVKDLRVNSFTDAEEVAVGLEKVVPFMLETRLRELGGRFEGTGNWQAFAIRDGQLITGQNPQSSHLVAQELLKALRTA